MRKNFFGKRVSLFAIIVMALFLGITTSACDSGGGGGGGGGAGGDGGNDMQCDATHPNWTWVLYFIDNDQDGIGVPNWNNEGGYDFRICWDGSTLEDYPCFTRNQGPWDTTEIPTAQCGAIGQLPSGTLTCTVNGTDVALTVNPVTGDPTQANFREGATQVGTDNTPPFGISLSNVASGSHTYVANLVNGFGNADTNTCTVTVGSTVGNPVVTITNPTNLSNQVQNVAFAVDATVVYTAAAINNVVYTVDGGATAVCTDVATPYSCNITFTTIGNHTITATANAANGRTGSATITVVVNAPTTQSCVETYLVFATGNYSGSGYGTGFYGNGPLPNTFPQMFTFENQHEVRAKGVVSPLAMSQGYFLMALNFTPAIVNQDGTIYWFPYQDNTGTIQSGLGRGLASIQFYFYPNCDSNIGVTLLDWNTVDNYQDGGNFQVWLDEGIDPITGNTVDIDAGLIPDADGDGIRDNLDNCVWVYNPLQQADVTNPIFNAAGDRTGNACQGIDSDNDLRLDLGGQDAYPLDYTRWDL